MPEKPFTVVLGNNFRQENKISHFSRVFAAKCSTRRAMAIPKPIKNA